MRREGLRGLCGTVSGHGKVCVCAEPNGKVWCSRGEGSPRLRLCQGAGWEGRGPGGAHIRPYGTAPAMHCHSNQSAMPVGPWTHDS